ncbi:MAG: endonuclease Q family protein [Clostridia bacterium]
MKEYYVDLHVHIGRSTGGHITKRGTANNLTLGNIAYEARFRKGIQVIGVVDCVSPWIIRDIEELLDMGELDEIPEGGLLYRKELVLLLGSEIETRERNRCTAHSLAFFPRFEDVKAFSREMDHYMTNLLGNATVSRLKGQELFDIVDGHHDTFIPAHVFTPHKSFYGNCTDRLKNVFREDALRKMPAIELGLSADTAMASQVSELDDKTFISNSDAHSLSRIGREYNVMALEALNYKEVLMALKNEGGRKITLNYGLDPRLGKYHRTFCLSCEAIFKGTPPILNCPRDPQHRVVVGVKDRLEMIRDRESQGVENRPPYHYQVPLQFLPGVGPKTINRLIDNFGNEMNILHHVSRDELEKVVSPDIAEKIVLAREGKLRIAQGGGGVYGKVIKEA